MNVNTLNKLKQNKMQGKGTEKQARISFILFLCILALLLITGLTGCSKEITTPDIPKPKLSLSLDPILPIDKNGYYHFLLYNRTPMGNNTHEIGGIALVNDIPVVGDPLVITFESSHYGLLPAGWGIIQPKQSYINYYTGQWTTVVLPSIIANRDYFLPTINTSCYANRKDGSIHGVIEPTFEMKGDTMTISAKYVYRYVTKMDGVWETDWGKDSIVSIKKIILE